MRTITGTISTNKVGSDCHFRFTVDDDVTPEEIEEMAREAAFDQVDWTYWIDGNSPD